MDITTIDITAAAEAGIGLDIILDADPTKLAALFLLFPGPAVTIEEV